MRASCGCGVCSRTLQVRLRRHRPLWTQGLRPRLRGTRGWCHCRLPWHLHPQPAACLCLLRHPQVSLSWQFRQLNCLVLLCLLYPCTPTCVEVPHAPAFLLCAPVLPSAPMMPGGSPGGTLGTTGGMVGGAPGVAGSTGMLSGGVPLSGMNTPLPIRPGSGWATPAQPRHQGQGQEPVQGRAAAAVPKPVAQGVAVAEPAMAPMPVSPKKKKKKAAAVGVSSAIATAAPSGSTPVPDGATLVGDSTACPGLWRYDAARGSRHLYPSQDTMR